ncbi:MAG TPA: MBL fold metallo-hydrolase [Candidatus Dormibacteraeota bacterium]|nr:MBL fold metallo-hydrolase [Candidatus Dormibacteraeota bacterium]
MEVAAGVHRLTQGVCNFYLIEDAGKLVLVDAGQTVGALGRRLDDLDAVLLTHAHADHTGFAERARTTAQARVLIHEADAAQARGAKRGKNDGTLRTHLLHPELYRTTFSLLRRGASRNVPIRELSTFADGEVLDVPGRPRVLHTPGHTPGTAALHIELRGLVLSGDTLVTRNPLTGRVGPQIMPAALNRDTPEALASLAALDRVAADTLLPGHGEPWTGGTSEAVRLARAAGVS